MEDAEGRAVMAPGWVSEELGFVGRCFFHVKKSV